MIVHVSAEGAMLTDPDDFGALAVSSALDPDGLREAVRVHAIGVVDADDAHVWLRPAALTGAAGPRASDSEWVAGLAGMVDYAAAHGWTDDQGRVRAHLATAG